MVKTKRSQGSPDNRKLTAREIIPDVSLVSNDQAALNLSEARCVLDQLLRIFERAGEVNQDCLYEILQLDIIQTRDFLSGSPDTCGDGEYLLSCSGGNSAERVFATMQMMLNAYLNEKTRSAAYGDRPVDFFTLTLHKLGQKPDQSHGIKAAISLP